MDNLSLWNTVQKQITHRNPICVFDFSDREGETDVMYIGHKLTPENVDFLRRNVGGPLSIYVSGQFLEKFGILPFSRFVKENFTQGSLLKLVESSRKHDPRFAISLDARENFTGCSPVETANTINSLYDIVTKAGKISDKELANKFVKSFIAPGHVPVIPSANNLLNERKGHVELSVTIAKIFGLPEIVVAGELIDPKNLKSMNRQTAEKFAKNQNFPFLTGEQVLKKIGL